MVSPIPPTSYIRIQPNHCLEYPDHQFHCRYAAKSTETRPEKYIYLKEPGGLRLGCNTQRPDIFCTTMSEVMSTQQLHSIPPNLNWRLPLLHIIWYGQIPTGRKPIEEHKTRHLQFFSTSQSSHDRG